MNTLLFSFNNPEDQNVVFTQNKTKQKQDMLTLECLVKSTELNLSRLTCFLVSALKCITLGDLEVYK